MPTVGSGALLDEAQSETRLRGNSCAELKLCVQNLQTANLWMDSEMGKTERGLFEDVHDRWEIRI